MDSPLPHSVMEIYSSLGSGAASAYVGSVALRSASSPTLDTPMSPRAGAKSDPALRPGQRPLYGVQEFDILKRQARITALAAASAYNAAGKVPLSDHVPPPDRPLSPSSDTLRIKSPSPSLVAPAL